MRLRIRCVVLAALVCFAIVGSSLSAQTQTEGPLRGWTLKNPFSKKKYTDPIEMSDHQPKRNLFEIPFSGQSSKNQRLDRLQSDDFSSEYAVDSPAEPSAIEVLREWDQKHRMFWRTTGESISQMAVAGTRRIRENTKNTWQTISGGVKMPEVKPLQFRRSPIFQRNRPKLDELPRRTELHQAPGQPRIKY